MWTDPISHHVMEQPVLAPAHDLASIQEWRPQNPSPPFTRAPMEVATLRTNRVVVQLLAIRRKFWPGQANG